MGGHRERNLLCDATTVQIFSGKMPLRTLEINEMKNKKNKKR